MGLTTINISRCSAMDVYESEPLEVEDLIIVNSMRDIILTDYYNTYKAQLGWG